MVKSDLLNYGDLRFSLESSNELRHETKPLKLVSTERRAAMDSRFRPRLFPQCRASWGNINNERGQGFPDHSNEDFKGIQL